MPGRLDGKVALIVGSATGMGAAGALMMAREGARVVLADVNHAQNLENAEQIKAHGGDALAVEMDITDEDSVKEGIARGVERFGTLHVLHNNAAAFGPNEMGLDGEADILNIDMGVYDRTMDINLRGYILTARHAVPKIVEAGGGSVINTASIDGLLPEPTRHAYCISKAGVIMLTRAIALAYGKCGVRCNAVCPGLVLTRDKEVTPYREMMIRHNLTPYAGKSEDLAAVFTFLASDESRYITGEAIKVDGGLMAKQPTSPDMLADPRRLIQMRAD